MYRIHINSSEKKLSSAFIPSATQLKKWAKLALQHKVRKGELAICLVNKREIRKLNKNFRHKDKATNVLSFKAELPKGVVLEMPLLGDIVICAAVVNEEAKKQNKDPRAHWAHMVIHGSLHILGYDHENDKDAIRMEKKEAQLLKQLGYPNPYF